MDYRGTHDEYIYIFMILYYIIYDIYDEKKLLTSIIVII